MKSFFGCLILVLVITGFSSAAIIRVPDDQPTIQAGIDAAQLGDTVLVADGTYTGSGNKNLDFKGKAITVTSENGAENCIIDCEADGRGFYFHSGETEASVVSGFTIRNGYIDGYNGGGILCENFSSPQIINCTITDNHGGGGGGFYCQENSSPRITNCIITRNHGGQGGGIFYYGIHTPPLIITDCEITYNTGYWGGGIACTSVWGHCLYLLFSYHY